MNRLFSILLTAFALGGTAAAQTAPPIEPSGAALSASAASGAGAPAPADCHCEAQQPLPEVFADINGVKITGRDLSERARARVSELQRQVVAARARELNLQIDSMLLEAEAKRRGVSATKVIEDEVVAKTAEPTEVEAQAFYKQNSARIQGEFKDAKEEIISYLRYQRQQQLAAGLAERLRAAASVKILDDKVTPPATTAERARVFATVNGREITSADIEESLRPLVFNVQEQVYALRMQDLDLKINDALLEQEAQRKKVTARALLDAEVTSKLAPVTEAEAQKFYEENKGRISGDFAQLKPQVTSYMEEQSRQKAALAFARRLREAATVRTYLVAPEPPVLKIATDDQPSKGDAAAPVMIVEFTDYQCPSCARQHPVLERLLDEYGGRVRLVVRDFPLEQHADAFKAAEAAEAAREQGKYWEYAAVLMQNQSELGVAKLKEYAVRLGLDRAKFNAALDSGRFGDKVRRDLQDGFRLGVSSTPSIFVNGRRASDRTYESLKASIEAALNTASNKSESDAAASR
ncbi:MAG: thioredoxin domain-containing protein [Acidobacteria bacterium]|nr:thioredoxin domain-containing protein [Acidobacteriota bacterium]